MSRSFVIIGSVAGFSAFPQAAKDVAPALTTAFMPVVNSAIAHTQALVEELGSTILGPYLLQLNTVSAVL